MVRPVTFLVVDDHPVFRQGLVALIRSNKRYHVCAEAGTVAESLAALEKAVPDIALVDISLVGQNGLDLVKTLKSAHPEVLVLIISMHDEVIYAELALKAGARGYMMKQEAASVMLDAIETVISGNIYVSAIMRDRLLETMFSRREGVEATSVSRLSDRELEVLELMGQGYGAAETAKALNLSVKTIYEYRDHIKEKLQIVGAGASAPAPSEAYPTSEPARIGQRSNSQIGCITYPALPKQVVQKPGAGHNCIPGKPQAFHGTFLAERS